MRRLCLMATLLLCAGVAAAAPQLAVWSVDPLIMVFPDASPEKNGPALAEIARGEDAVLQVVVRSDQRIEELRAQLSRLSLPGRPGATLRVGSIRFVGYVPVDRPTQEPARDQLRKPPADYPDPLLEKPSVDVPAEQAQAVWITIPIPKTAPAGLYQGRLHLSAKVDGKRAHASLPVRVKVYPVTVGASRLWVTNWFSMHGLHMKVDPKPDTPEYWALLRRYARDMAAHRQNLALIHPLDLSDFGVDGSGQLTVDFSRFDRWVEIFTEEGVVGRIEGGHLGGRRAGWQSQFVMQIRRVADGKVESANVNPASPEADAFYAWFFPRLVSHLQEKGWLDHYLQHLGDEPIAFNAKSYRDMAALVHKYAPGLKIIEACHTKDLVGAMDVWVPQLNYLHDDYAHYQSRQAAGEEVWFYTCVFPQGEYANRFIELPLIKTRLLHWINFRYGITGYLHWGYNWWVPETSPFERTTRPHTGPAYLPAGDAWVVYPGEDGPLDSIRFEAMRDGIADYELLSLLAERDAPAAMRLAERHILAFDKYNCDVAAFRATRRELLTRLAQ